MSRTFPACRKATTRGNDFDMLGQHTGASTHCDCGTGTSATGKRFTHAALEDAQHDARRAVDLHEADVDPLRKRRMAFDAGAEPGYRCVGGGRNGNDGVRVAHRDDCKTDRFAVDIQSVACSRYGRQKRQGLRRKKRLAHLDGDQLALYRASADDSACAVQTDAAIVAAALPEQQCRHGACSIAALFDLAAIGVEDPVVHGCVRAARRRQRQGLVETDAGASVRERLQLCRTRDGGFRRGIENDEVVAEPVHLRERQLHWFSLARMDFRIRIEPQGRQIVARSDQDLLDAALAAGLNLPHSCKAGHCGSCRARLVEGRIDYPRGLPLGLTAHEHANQKILLCQARACSDVTVETRLIPRAGDTAIKRLPARIARRTLLAPDVLQLMLRLPAVETLEFRPGQYLDVLLDGGRRRSFSIASPPHDSRELEVHLRRAPGTGFTATMFDAGSDGTLLRIEAPLGQFCYLEGDSPVLMIAGGTGFAPLKSMLRHALETGATRPIHFFWGARTALDLYEDQLVQQWTRQYPNLSYRAVLSATAEVQHSHHQLGWVHEVAAASGPPLTECEVYVAGPPALIEAVRERYPALGVSGDRLYFDSFDYAAR